MFEDQPVLSNAGPSNTPLILCYNDDSKLNFPIENLAIFVILSLNYNPQRRSADPPTMRCFGLSSSQARVESSGPKGFPAPFQRRMAIAFPPDR